MGADDRADGHGQNLPDVGEALFDRLRELLGLRGRVAVADDDGVVFRREREFRHAVEQELLGALFAAALRDCLELPLVVDDEDRLNLERGADDGGRRGNPAAAAQVVEVVDLKAVADALLMLLDPSGERLIVHAVLPAQGGLIDEQKLADGRAQRIDAADAPLGVGPLQRLHAALGRLDCAA